MFIDLTYDKDASKLVGKPTFFCEEYPLSYKDIIHFKHMGVLKLVEETTLPNEIPCQVIMNIENATHMKYMFFNPDFPLPTECYDEPLLNRNLLERSSTHGGFWLEVMLHMEKQYMKLNIDTETEK